MEKIDYIIEMVRRIKEEGPTMAMGNGQIAGSVENKVLRCISQSKRWTYTIGG